MIVYFGLDGRLKETVSSYTLRDSGGNEHVSFGRRKGSAGANEILAIFEGGAPTKGALAITYRLPSGEFYEPADLVVDNAYTGYIEFDRTQDLKHLEYEKKYEVVEFDFPNGLFPKGGDGLYLATVRNIQGETLIRAYGLITFSVEDSAVQRDSSITESQYDYLVSLIESSPLYVRKAGDTMTGPLNVPAGTTEMGGATEKEIVNKKYVDEGLDRKFDKMGGTIGGLVSVQGDVTASGDVKSTGGSFSSPQIAWNSPDKIPNAKDVTEYFVNKKRNNFSAAKETVETLVDFQTAPKSQQEPTAGDDLATKGYVDKVAASAGGYNLENGTGEDSIQQKGSQAVGSHSAALGLGAYAGSEGEVAVGRYNEKGDAAYVVGAGTSDSDRKNAIHVARTGAVTVGRTDKGAGVNLFADNFFFEASGQAVFNVKQATFAGNISASSITATTFKSVTAENLSTKQYTIGLAKGNTEAIQSYIGLYAEKYDGENYGALVWDSTGTAYVGDASVDENGVVTDPNKQLQPILTRDSDASMSSSAFGLIYWNAIMKRAENSGIQISSVPDKLGENWWTGWQTFSGGFGLGPKSDESPVLWFNKDANGKALVKANGQTVQFQDAKGGVVAYLSDLDDKASKSEFENLVKVTATDVGKDANGFAVLCHDGVEITGQKKSVKLADVRENGAIIGRDQATSAPQTNELITKAYGDKEYKTVATIELTDAQVASVQQGKIAFTQEQFDTIKADGVTSAILMYKGTLLYRLFVSKTTFNNKLWYTIFAIGTQAGDSSYSSIMLFGNDDLTKETEAFVSPLCSRYVTHLNVEDGQLTFTDNGDLGTSLFFDNINGKSVMNDNSYYQKSYYAPETINSTDTPKYLKSASGAMEWVELSTPTITFED